MNSSPQSKVGSLVDEPDDFANRSRSRNRFIVLGAIGSGLGKVGGLLVTLLSIPMAVSALGPERFGIWITVTTLAGFVSLLDGGIGNSLINLVGECLSRNEQLKLSKIISSAYWATCLIALAGMLLHSMLIAAIDWTWLLSLPDTVDPREVSNVVWVFGITYFLMMPLSLSGKILTAIQRIHLMGYASLIGHFATLTSTTVAWWLGADLIVFVLCFASGPLLAGVVNTSLAWMREGHRYMPSLHFDRHIFFTRVLKTGLLFWMLQICAVLAFQTDTLIVAHLCGLEAAGEFGLTSRLFQVAYSLTLLATAPLWPAVREASLMGDVAWIRRTLRKFLILCLAASLAFTIPIAIVFRPLNDFWTNRQIDPSNLLVVSVFIWTNLLVVGNILAMFLNGLHIVRMQLVCSLLMLLLNIILSIVLTIMLGPPGVVLGSIISYLLVVLIPFSVALPKLIDTAGRGTVATVGDA